MEAFMRKAMMLMAVVALVGCGPNFGGTFRGTVIDTGSCTDGSSGTSSSGATLNVTDNAGTLTLVLGGFCDPIVGKAAGNTAALTPKSCPVQSSGGITQTPFLDSGSLTLNEPNLVLTMAVRSVFSNGSASITCSDTFGGTLIRQSSR